MLRIWNTTTQNSVSVPLSLYQECSYHMHLISASNISKSFIINNSQFLNATTAIFCWIFAQISYMNNSWNTMLLNLELISYFSSNGYNRQTDIYFAVKGPDSFCLNQFSCSLSLFVWGVYGHLNKRTMMVLYRSPDINKLSHCFSGSFFSAFFSMGAQVL